VQAVNVEKNIRSNKGRTGGDERLLSLTLLRLRDAEQIERGKGHSLIHNTQDQSEDACEDLQNRTGKQPCRTSKSVARSGLQEKIRRKENISENGRRELKIYRVVRNGGGKKRTVGCLPCKLGG